MGTAGPSFQTTSKRIWGQLVGTLKKLVGTSENLVGTSGGGHIWSALSGHLTPQTRHTSSDHGSPEAPSVPFGFLCAAHRRSPCSDPPAAKTKPRTPHPIAPAHLFRPWVPLSPAQTPQAPTPTHTPSDLQSSLVPPRPSARQSTKPLSPPQSP